MSTDSRSRPTDDDEGKDVIDATGERVGIVVAVEGDVAHVETDPGITDEIAARLGWGDAEETHPVDESDIERITDDELRLGSNGSDEPGEASAEDLDHDPAEEPSTGEAATRGIEEEDTDLSAEERSGSPENEDMTEVAPNEPRDAEDVREKTDRLSEDEDGDGNDHDRT